MCPEAEPAFLVGYPHAVGHTFRAGVGGDEVGPPFQALRLLIVQDHRHSTCEVVLVHLPTIHAHRVAANPETWDLPDIQVQVGRLKESGDVEQLVDQRFALW